MRTLARRLTRVPGRLAYALAQSEAGAWLAATAISRVPWALPVPRLVTQPEAVAFRHPRPQVRDHVVVVPRTRVRDLATLAQRGDVAVLRSMILAAEEACRLLPEADRVLSINVGVRLDVAQLHGHVLAVPAARRLLAEAAPPFEAPRDDLTALGTALEAAMLRLEGGAPHVEGSLLIAGLGTPVWPLASSVARGGGSE